MVNKRLLTLSIVLALTLVLILAVHAENSTGNNDSGNSSNETLGGNQTNVTCTANSDCQQGYKCENKVCKLENKDKNETENECEWQCTKWSDCSNSTQTRSCTNINNCTGKVPKQTKKCENAEKCDGIDNRTERINCRLQNMNRFANFSESDEACDGLRNRGLCVALYVRSQNCFKAEDGEKRDKCFKMVEGFKEAQIDKEVNKSNNKTEAREKVRNYMVLVLTNLQHKVEKAVNKSRITPEQGAALIDKIEEIKQSILNGEARATIKTKLQELKTLWKSYKADKADE
ncbi:hypothetical protein HY212_07520 [Candidatus Pacearchaeota archaeon]|nr:hypothetical protein [Candidatus Pacearchaeota archaeon]